LETYCNGGQGPPRGCNAIEEEEEEEEEDVSSTRSSDLGYCPPKRSQTCDSRIWYKIANKA
jgi:hypothetical protein